MFALRRRSRSEISPAPAEEMEVPTPTLTMREGLLHDEKYAQQNAAGIDYLGKEPRYVTYFVIAPPPARFPMCVSAVVGEFVGSRRHRLRRFAREISSPQVEHTILDDPERPNVCIHRIVINP